MAIIDGDNTDNILNGTVDDDIINGLNGNDTITGGQGDDTLIGGRGNDTYFYTRGDGNDIIDEGFNQENDTLTFSGVNSTDVTVTLDGIDLILTIAESSVGAGDGGSVRLNNNASLNLETGVETINFADNVTWTEDDLRQVYLNSVFTSGDDIVTGFNGNDSFTGGLGDDIITGDDGSDSYFYTRGDGNDTIIEGSNQEFDTLTFTGVNSTDVTITRDGNDLILNIAESSVGAGDDGSVRLGSNALPGFSAGVDSVIFADSVTWDSDMIRSLYLSDQFTTGDDVVTAFNGNDTLIGGLGDDILTGDDGDDNYIYARGDGNDIIIEGSNQEFDTLTFTNIDSTDVTFTRDGNNLTLVIAESTVGAGDGGSVQLNNNVFVGFNVGVDEVVFADSVTWDTNDIRQNYLNTLFTPGDDVIAGTDGNDTFIGGLGDDTYTGDDGDDSYFYTRGDGNDIIIEGTNQEVDTLTFIGVDSTDVTVTRDGLSLTLEIAESAVGAGDAGSVEITLGGSIGFRAGVETINFSDGEVWTDDILRQKYVDSQTTDGDDDIMGFEDAQRFSSSLGNDTLRGDRGNDVYEYARGDGDDIIIESSAGGTDRLELLDTTSTDFDISVDGIAITISIAETSVGAGDGGSVVLSRALGTFAQDGTESILTSDGVFFTAQQLSNFRSDKLGTAAEDTLTGTAGTDILSGGASDDYIVGGAGNDFLRGDAGDDILNGGFGVDYLRGGAGADQLIGFAGQDWADYVTSGAAVIVDLLAGTAFGGDAEGDTFSFVERVYGSRFDDTITGDTGVNYLRGHLGDDSLNGGDGSDYLQGDAGADALDGGSGSDWAYYASSAAGLTVNLGNTALNTGEAIGDSYTSIENLVGSRFNDDLTGDSGDNILRGFLGDDTLQGGLGNDFIRGGTGADIHDGGDGLDWAYYVGSSAAITVNLGANTGAGGEAAGDTFISIERVFGSRFDDNITGDSGANYLRGFFGNDILNGGDGADFLQGDAGADTLDGGAGSDWAYYASSTALLGITINLGNASLNTGEAAGDSYTSIENVVGSQYNDIITGDSGDNYLRGFLGDDTINGGTGNDTLRGEAGADTFVFTSFGWGDDTVTDFTNGEDLLDFSALGLSLNDFLVEQVGNDTVLTLLDGFNETVTLLNFNALDIDATDFV